MKKRAGRTVVILKDDDVGDAKCCINIMRILVSSRHIGRLRQLGFHGEHLVVVNDDASIRAFDDPVHIEELLRHGDKTLPLMVARPPSGVAVQSHRLQRANQMAEKVAKGPLTFQDTIMTAQYTTSLKSKSSHTLKPKQSLVATRLLNSAGTASERSVSKGSKQSTHDETAQEVSVNASGVSQSKPRTTQQLVLLNHTAESEDGVAVDDVELKDAVDSGINAWIDTFQVRKHSFG